MLLCLYMIRTTVRLEENLFKEARKKAIDQRIAFAEIINEALSLYLNRPQKYQPKRLNSTDFVANLANYKLKGAPKDLAQKHDKYTWE